MEHNMRQFNEPEPVRLCKYCRYAHRRWPDRILFLFSSWRYAYCHHPKIGIVKSTPSLVDGKKKKDHQWFCSSNRIFPCGPEAVYWEPRDGS